MAKLSVTIACKNEAKRLPACLAQLRFADEIIVVDDVSEDDSAAIAKRFGAKVFIHDSKGNFHDNKNLAIAKAKHEWILSLDADEIVPPELAAEIVEEIAKTDKEAFNIGRKNYFLGQWIQGCGWYPDHTIRLFRKGVSQWPREIHDTPQVAAGTPTATLKNEIEHYSYVTLEHYFEKFNRYTTKLAREADEKGIQLRPYNLPWYAGVKPTYWFWNKYLLGKGYKDGFWGFFISFSSAATVFVSHAKLYALQDRKRENNAAEPSTP